MTSTRRHPRCPCGAALPTPHSDGAPTGAAVTGTTSQRCPACATLTARFLLEPPDAPAAFWDEPGLSKALAARHMGRVTRAWRTHPHHGRRPIPQDIVAAWFGITQAQLSRIENGPPIVHLDRLTQWARILRIPERFLWFRLPGTSPHSEEQAATGVPVIWPGEPADPVSASPGTGATPAVDAEHLAAVRGNARRYLDGEAVEYFRERLAACADDDGTHGPRQTLPGLLGVLGAVERSAREVRPGVRRELLAVGARGAELAGWLYRDLGLRAPAGAWHDRAMEWAQEAGDLPMQGYVLLRKSQMAYDERDGARVLGLARAAHAGPWALPARVRAEVIQQEAHGLAMTGAAPAEVERRLDEARRAFGAAGQAVTDPDELGGSYDEQTLTLRTASCYVEAGTPARAAELYREALGSGRLSERDAGYFRARRSVALALCGEPDIAAEQGLAAVATMQTTHSQRTRQELARALEALRPWNGRPGPRALQQALGAAGTS